jgi:hypothetical protein
MKSKGVKSSVWSEGVCTTASSAMRLYAVHLPPAAKAGAIGSSELHVDDGMCMTACNCSVPSAVLFATRCMQRGRA